MHEPEPIPSIQSVTPALCRLLRVPVPALSVGPPPGSVTRAAHEIFSDRPATRCLVFAPDALGDHLFAHLPTLLQPVLREAPLAVSLRSVFPPKTPVCFASMFTGAAPADHGIRKYERPVLRCDTLFDAFLRAGKRVALVAVADSSMDVIFRSRGIEYFSERYDPEVTARTLTLIEEDRHDLIVAYQQEYDDRLHERSTFAPEALLAAGRHVASFTRLAERAAHCWRGHDRVLLFAPDHGAHVNAGTGKGDHGENIPEDMLLKHFYGLYARELPDGETVSGGYAASGQGTRSDGGLT